MDVFYSFKRIKGTQVKLPNGNYAIAEIVGIVHIISSIVLHDVLYLPIFNVNLISIDKIAKELKMIGFGRLHNVLYYLEDGRDVNNHAAPCTT